MSGVSSGWVGREIGKHLVLEEIGRGGMGVVYRAYHRELRCCVALKVIRSGAMASPEEIQRLRKEALAASRLQHPNIVRVREVGEHEGQHYFTMDFVAGTTLAAKVREHSLPSDVAARWVAILARAVAYAHGQRVVHRDLKPGNVLIDAEGRLHLADFGLAKVLEPDEDPTVSGIVLGTPGYMSPEQVVARRGAVGEPTDIYALGAILYELLTGRPPFRAETPVETLKQVLEVEPAAPHLLNRNVPSDLETVCLKCLTKDPAGRYATASELADDLERYLRREPIRARPAGPLKRVWRWAQRHPAVAALTLAQTMLLFAMSWAAFESRKLVKGTNREAAMAISGDIDRRLRTLCRTVTEAAADPGLRAAFGQADRESLLLALRGSCERLKQRHGEDFENWVIMDAQGQALARHPPPRQALRVRRTDRSYFQWATNQWATRRLDGAAPQAIVSAIYESDDDGLLKIGVSCALTDAEGRLLGVIAGMAGAESLVGGMAGGSPADPWRWEGTASLAGPFDRGSPRTTLQADHALFLHLGQGILNSNLVRALKIDHTKVRRLLPPGTLPATPPRAPTRELEVDELYWDPYPDAGGLWTAVFVRVGDHPLVVIYQKRNPIATVLIPLVLAVGVITIGFWWGMARRDRMRRST